MARKTVSVEWLKQKTNSFLAHSADEMAAERKGMFALLESALHETGNYRGFNYLPSQWSGDVLAIHDETRRFYY